MKKENITCPHCGKANTWLPDNPARPFCSDRCKLIDLGEWADEKYKIPLDPDSSESDVPSENQDDKE